MSYLNNEFGLVDLSVQAGEEFDGQQCSIGSLGEEFPSLGGHGELWVTASTEVGVVHHRVSTKRNKKPINFFLFVFIGNLQHSLRKSGSSFVNVLMPVQDEEIVYITCI